MRIMYIGRYNGQFLHFDNMYRRIKDSTTPADLTVAHPLVNEAKAASVNLFGRAAYGSETPVEPTAGVKFEYCNSFFQSWWPLLDSVTYDPNAASVPGEDSLNPKSKGFGWVVIIDQTSEDKMEIALNLHDSVLRSMYTIEKLYLNDDSQSDEKGQTHLTIDTKQAYIHMSPTHWA